MQETEDVTAYRVAAGHFATGVTVVTSSGKAGPVGATANAVCSLSLDPLLFIVCLDLGSRTLGAVRDTGRLAVNVLAADQRSRAIRFASKEPEAQKFVDVDWSEVDGMPVLDGVVAWFTGEVRELLPGGDHVIAVVALRRVASPGGQPLLYYRGVYHTLGTD